MQVSKGAKIQRLDPQTIDQIAAGEVVESPASVVKELIENSVDAGAKEVIVEIALGGKERIRVIDDGEGMGEADARLSVEKHATSKIRSAKELFMLQTLGFRGEALSSIAAISDFSLLTRQRGAKEGTFVALKGGELVESSLASCSFGTEVEVRSLFFNVPARKAFQRSHQRESQEVRHVVELQALAHPEVAFTLIADGKSVVQTGILRDGGVLERLEQRIEELLGERGWFPLEWEGEALSLFGWIGGPDRAGRSRRRQVVIVNKRPVDAPLVAEGVLAGYGPAIASHSYPPFVLHLAFPPDRIDVNVHPQKREVRFSAQKLIKEALFTAVDRALQREVAPPAFAPHAFSAGWEEVQEKELPPLFFSEGLPPPAEEQQLQLFEAGAQPLRLAITLVGYLVLEGDGERLKLVDQRAAHRRILFEKLLDSGEGYESVQLLVPETVELSSDEVVQLKEMQPQLEALGVAFELFGSRRLIVRALPALLERVGAEQLIHTLLDGSFQKERERQLARLAGFSALSRKQRLTKEEGQALLDELVHCKKMDFCPLGEPIMLAISVQELARSASNGA